MKVSEIVILNEKAKTRKNGVYSFRGNLWVVKENKFVAFANYFGECFQRAGAFNLQIGTVQKHERREKLNTWLKAQ